MKQIQKILVFSVQISSSSVSTVVLDTIVSENAKGMKVDCRGHFIQENQSVAKLLDSTALLPSMQNQQQGIENTLVVSFYLLTREAGLVFQSIAELLSHPQSLQYLPIDQLISLINIYFFALINLKHMGSVDRISIGLSKMAKVIFKHQSQQLSQVPQTLLNKLLNYLQQGHFKNILRRSAGIPYAFCCLLKSEAVKRKSLIEKTIQKLIKHAENKQGIIQYRIHALNILKKLFQDSDLKQDLDPFLSSAFIISMKGFSSQDWGVRNSSLMLFSILANRTVGIKPTFNLLEFFHKCPQLLDFVQEQLRKPTENIMYPSLYPLVLLLSRLLPFDIKEKSRMTIKGTTIKQVRKQQLLTLLPLIEQAGSTNNYMGRAMTAKAILPFLQLSTIIPYSLNILNTITLKNMNKTHFDVLRAYQLIKSYYQLCSDTGNEQWIPLILKILLKQCSLISKIKCPTVQQVLIKIYHKLISSNYNCIKKINQYNQLEQAIKKNCKLLLNQCIYNSIDFTVQEDLGYTHMRISLIQLNLDIHTYYYYQTKSFTEHYQFFQMLWFKLDKDQQFFKKIDTQIVKQYLQHSSKLIQEQFADKQLFGILQKFINKLNIKDLTDNIFIQILKISRKLKISLNPKIYLSQLIIITKNTKLQIQLFKYLSINNQNIDNFLQIFSSPDQLQQLRQCCIQYLSSRKKIQKKLYVICIRLLQDQQPQIRRYASQQISKCMGYKSYNPQYLKKIILQNIQKQQFQKLQLINIDYQIKKKNNQQQRIFAYDKPNKYRSDIQTLAYILINNKTLSKKDIKILFNQYYQNAYQLFFNNILMRNQYKFENLLRNIINNPSNQVSQKISHIHPIFEKVRKRLLQLQ